MRRIARKGRRASFAFCAKWRIVLLFVKPATASPFSFFPFFVLWAVFLSLQILDCTHAAPGLGL